MRLDMAVRFPALSSGYDAAEQDSLVPARSVASLSFFHPYLFPAFLHPVKQFPVYDLRVVFRAEIIMVLQNPADGCVRPCPLSWALHTPRAFRPSAIFNVGSGTPVPLISANWLPDRPHGRGVSFLRQLPIIPIA